MEEEQPDRTKTAVAVALGVLLVILVGLVVVAMARRRPPPPATPGSMRTSALNLLQQTFEETLSQA